MGIQILLAAIGSAGFFSFLEFLINRKDQTKQQLEDIKTQICLIEKRDEKAERDSVRTQMLIMMNHYPDETTEIMKLAEHYFAELHGDWYMTSLFNKWLESKHIGKPEWFNSEG